MRTIVLTVLWMLVASTGAPAHAAEGYLLQPGDVLVVAVWKEPELSLELLVRPDGGISMPLAGDVEAAGHSAEQVRAVIDERLRKFVPDPSVTVAVKSASGNQVFIIGKVNRPGQYPMNRPLDVMQVLSLAGGATPFATVNDIRVLRREGDRQISIPFNYGQVESGRHLEQNIVLRGGDTVVVP
ncbi:MAG TPA: polysaccharide biosynthesis/export family protein [Burkholderiaceae bacterium]|nr:polysaccharide biosynthesis/export family protein [Burkholderiaceae bacterium]